MHLQVLSQMTLARLSDGFAYSAAIGAVDQWQLALVLLDEALRARVADVVCFSACISACESHGNEEKE